MTDHVAVIDYRWVDKAPDGEAVNQLQLLIHVDHIHHEQGMKKGVDTLNWLGLALGDGRGGKLVEITVWRPTEKRREESGEDRWDSWSDWRGVG